MIYLDTHMLIWLYEGRLEKIASQAQLLIETNELLASPMSILELQYLYEIKRITVLPNEIIEYLNMQIGLTIDDSQCINIIKQSLHISWTRDPFDRLIVAGAQLRQIFLLTKDTVILKNYPLATWDQHAST